MNGDDIARIAEQTKKYANADGEREQIHPPLQREWKDLTTAEIKTLWNATKKPTEFAALLLAKVKEKNT